MAAAGYGRLGTCILEGVSTGYVTDCGSSWIASVQMTEQGKGGEASEEEERRKTKKDWARTRPECRRLRRPLQLVLVPQTTPRRRGRGGGRKKKKKKKNKKENIITGPAMDAADSVEGEARKYGREDGVKER